MTSAVFDAAGRLALAFREQPKVEQFLQAFDLSGHRDFAMRVNEVSVRYSFLQDSPLLLGVRMNRFPPAVEELLAEKDGETWLVNAIDVGQGFQVVIEFLRSRLPGYPMLRVPHRRVGSPYLLGTDPLIVHHFPWDRSLTRLSLQLKPPPDLKALGGDLTGTDLQQDLAESLPELESWQAFQAASRALTESDRATLSELGTQFGREVADEVVTTEAGERLMAQYQYRMAVLRERVEGTSGRVLDYLLAFEEVDRAITIVVNFMQTMIVEGGIMSVQPERVDLGDGGDFIDADVLIAGGSPFLKPGTVFAVDGRPSGLIHPEAVQHRWQNRGESTESTMRIHGQFIPD